MFLAIKVGDGSLKILSAESIRYFSGIQLLNPRLRKMEIILTDGTKIRRDMGLPDPKLWNEFKKTSYYQLIKGKIINEEEIESQNKKEKKTTKTKSSKSTKTKSSKTTK